MNDLIPRAAARDVINTWGRHENEDVRMDLLHNDMNAIPAVDAIPVEWLNDVMLTGDTEDSKAAWRMLHKWNDEHFFDIGKM